MSRQRLSIAVGLLVALAVGIIIWLPARWGAHLLPSWVRCEGLSGRLWQGRCEGLGIRRSRSGSLAWAVAAPAPGSFRPQLRILWENGDSAARVLLHRSSTGDIELRELEASVSLQTLRNTLPADLSIGPLAAVDARLETSGFSLRLGQDGRLLPLGEWRLRQTRLLRGDILLGDFVASFPTHDPAYEHAGYLRDLDGPLGIEGRVDLLPQRAYVVTLRLSPRNEETRRLLLNPTQSEVRIEGRL